MVKGTPTNRSPYYVRYRDMDGELKSIRRVPPAKLHDMMPDDVVTISRKRSDNWEDGEEVKVIGINPKQPNTLMVEKENGTRTFLAYSDLKTKPRTEADIAYAEELRERANDPIGSDYLLWP
ncbi:MAG: hypothetical protein RJB13_2293 [Pseudomonadota bacterium]|jgi:hypothetical protein